MNGSGVSAVSAYTAHREWARRPPDERYDSVAALHAAACARRSGLGERTIETRTFRTEAVGSDALVLREASGREAALTHWSFEQLATIAGAPPNLLIEPRGCPFSPRCDFTLDRCWAENPPLTPVDGQHRIACWVDVRTGAPR